MLKMRLSTLVKSRQCHRAYPSLPMPINLGYGLVDEEIARGVRALAAPKFLSGGAHEKQGLLRSSACLVGL